MGRGPVRNQLGTVGKRISFGDRITVDGKPGRVRINPPPPRVLAYHKPVGEIVTYGAPRQRPTVFRRLPRPQQGKWQSVGRLDVNTEGLLLFTNSGDLATRLMHPRFGVEREYAVRDLGTLSRYDAKVTKGLGILSLTVVGPQTPWGYLGIVPLLTGLVGTCPAYTLFGISTCNGEPAR